ncbi:hypothetical protein A6O24_17500 [Acidithiobacillus thiooxidans]|uniref:Uncharacterized protein n=1 Tax=Acidithiobacillus thiooxidans TaxID=930 RepID=A0A1C2IDU8_ACITH|nr:hypothetical protein A6O24_17500 [Acidithiobacillus thiooxidans]OCX74146.1 hypothetical protein A6P07_06280 [Acidithiobacillus thiooxidans]
MHKPTERKKEKYSKSTKHVHLIDQWNVYNELRIGLKLGNASNIMNKYFHILDMIMNHFGHTDELGAQTKAKWFLVISSG